MNHFHHSGGCCHGHGESGHHREERCCHSGHSGHSGHGGRHFYSQEERIQHLEEYLKQLQAEAKGVEEYLSKIKTEK